MELILNKNLPHQEKAIQAVNKCFDGVEIKKSNFAFQNPLLNVADIRFQENINFLQNKLHNTLRFTDFSKDYLNIDIKMETGTGKTYVYTQSIYELHQNYGFNKFILLVPSLAIKAGAEKFLSSQSVKQHFKNVHGYSGDIELHVLESKKSKKNKNYFPTVIREFVTGSHHAKNKIHVLLSNMQLFQEKKQGLLTREDYDTSVEGFFKPIEAICSTLPIVMLDEPHRFSREQKTFQFIESEVKPQCVIRFGATFPETMVKIDKKKSYRKDYCNLVYNLGAAEAFNLNLVKGIAKEHLEPINDRNDKMKIVSIDSNKSVSIQYLRADSKTKSLILNKGDSLSLLDESVGNLYIESIGKDHIELSNSQIKFTGEEFSTDIYSTSYQEQMIKLAIDRHFEVERENFERECKIKTLALFFIDDIYSYRNKKDSTKAPYLKVIFEKLLEDKIEQMLLDETLTSEYREYLIASKKDLNQTHAGYFSQDNSDKDEDIAQEVKEILSQKEKLLSIKNEDNSYNVRRFLFSKWTLKEGWDNPNIFTITKLRSSGSENSKLQEVGRGLRLPVDINGNRISNDEFFLNYIVDFTEAQFAEELINQINSEIPEKLILSEAILKEIANRLNISEDDVFAELLFKKLIDRNSNVNMDKQSEMREDYPECEKLFNVNLNRGKVRDSNKNKDNSIKIRKDEFSKIKNFWELLNSTYHIIYKDITEDNMDTIIKEILKENLFTVKNISSKREKIIADESGKMIVNEESKKFIVNEQQIPYNQFIMKINELTNIPLKKIHSSLISISKEVDLKKNKFTQQMALNFSRSFNNWKLDLVDEHIEYRKSAYSRKTTALTDINGNVKDSISQGRLGVKVLDSEPIKGYLYEKVTYDSPLEKDNIISELDETIVYGKIPRNSIRIPMVDGGSYSPDFMYIVKSPDDSREKVVIETKDVLSTEDIRGVEKIKIKSAIKFFESIKNNGDVIYYQTQYKDQNIKDVIDAIINTKN